MPPGLVIALVRSRRGSQVGLSVDENYGFSVTITTPCDGTVAENFPVNFPRSFFCHKSRTDTDICAG